MFCKKCGAEMKDDARFCPKCGFDRMSKEEKSKKEVVEDNEVKFQLKPKFKLGYKLLTTVGRGVLYILIFAFYIFAEMDDAKDYAEASDAMGAISAIVIAIIVLYIVIKLIFEKIQYNHYEYNFYNTKVEYVDGFLNKEEKELKYKFIREVTMSQNILERAFGIGKIKIYTNASSGMYEGEYGNSMKNKNGIQIHCVENVKEQYQKVKELIDAGTENE